MEAPPLGLGELQSLAATATALARAGGDALMRRFRTDLPTESKGRRRELVTAADREAEQVVVGGLLQRFPDHAVLAEEGVLTVQGQQSRASDWTWIVDPLDGTTNFVHGLPGFAVALALAWRKQPIVGVVHAPALGDTYVAVRGGGATCNDRRLQVTRTTELADALLATGFSYNRDEPGRDDNGQRLLRVLPRCRDLRRFGSAELDLCLVGRGAFDGYWEMYLAPYDVAAGALVVREAGGSVTDLDGGDDWLFGGHILATNGHLHDALRSVVGPAPTG